MQFREFHQVSPALPIAATERGGANVWQWAGEVPQRDPEVPRNAASQILRSKVVAIEKRSSIDFLRTTLERHSRGELVMPVERLTGAAFPGIDIVEHVSCSAGSGWFADRIEPRHDSSAAQITLTSGTTGTPKLMLLSHRALGDVTVRLADAMNLDDSIREYVGVPVTYSFGFGRIRAVAAVGGASFLPERGFRVDELAAMLQRGEVNALSAVPTLLRLAIEQQDRLKEAGRKLRWLEIGSQAMTRKEKESIRALFPNARIIQHYGLTEASRSTFLNITAEEGTVLDSVGRPNGGVDVKITQEGLIAIRGPNVADGIVTADGVQAISGVDGWLVTRDLGHERDGFLYFEGRADHLINVGGIKIPAELFEEKLLARMMPGTSFAVAGGRDPLRGEIVVVAHEPSKDPFGTTALDRAASAVAAELNIREGVVLFPVDALPRTETNKVRRGDISAMFEESLRKPTRSSASRAPRALDNDPTAGVADTFAATFGEAGRNRNASFNSLGGDSLHYVTMLTGLELYIADIPEDWDTLSIGALSALAVDQAAKNVKATERKHLPRNLDSVRGLACVLIVALHVVGVSSIDGLKLPDGSAWHDVMRSLNIVRLPLFTAMAGFLYGAMPATRRGYGEFMKRKARQFLVPLLFATLVFWVVRRVTYGEAGSLFWAYVDGYQHLWYIDALLLIFGVVAFIDTRTRSVWKPWLALIAVIAVSYYSFPDIPVMHAKNAVFLTPFFVAGLMLYRIPPLLESRALLVVSALAMVSLIALQQFSVHEDNLLFESGVLSWICGTASVITLLHLFPKTSWLERIAAYSFTIYLWHPAANGMIRNALLKVGVHSVPLLFAVGLAAGVLIPIGLHRLMLRLPKLSAPVIGR